jgi:hypothetical protein
MIAVVRAKLTVDVRALRLQGLKSLDRAAIPVRPV